MTMPSQPVGQSVSHYRILSKIGGGGIANHSFLLASFSFARGSLKRSHMPFLRYQAYFWSSGLWAIRIYLQFAHRAVRAKICSEVSSSPIMPYLPLGKLRIPVLCTDESQGRPLNKS